MAFFSKKKTKMAVIFIKKKKNVVYSFCDLICFLFTDRQVSFEDLKFLERFHLDEVFSSNELGRKVRFTRFLKIWQMNQVFKKKK